MTYKDQIARFRFDNSLTAEPAGFARGELSVEVPAAELEKVGYGGSTDDGDPTGSDVPMFLDVRPEQGVPHPEGWDVDQVLYLPGKPGNLAHIKDTNLLDADSAHLEQSVGDWYRRGDQTVLSITGEEAWFGTKSLKVDCPGVYLLEGAYLPSDPVRRPLATDQDNRVGVWVKAPAGLNMRVTTQQHHAGGAGALGDTPFVGTGDWQWVARNATNWQPDGESFGWYVRVNEPTPTPATFYIGAAVFRHDTVEEFVPSLRVVGDLEASVAFAPSALTSASYQTLLSHDLGGGVDERHFYLDMRHTDGAIRALSSGHASTHFGVHSAAGEPGQVRVRVRTDEGSVEVATAPMGSDEWTVVGTAVGTPGPSTGNISQPLRIGQSGLGNAMGGVVFSATYRDGIDGPVIASVDFTNTDEVTGDTWTTPEGLPGEVVRGGTSATAQLVQRTAFAFAGLNDQRLTIAGGDDLFPFAAGQARTEYTGLMVTATAGGLVGSARVAADGWQSQTASFGRVQLLVQNAGGSSIAASGNDVIGQAAGFKVLGFVRKASGALEVRADGTIVATDTGAATAGAGASRGGDVALGAVVTTGASPLGHLRQWEAWFTRELTEPEHAELAAWDGSVATEPEWLRDAAVLYLNAADPFTRTAYLERGEIVNLIRTPDQYVTVQALATSGEGVRMKALDLEESIPAGEFVRGSLTKPLPSGGTVELLIESVDDEPINLAGVQVERGDHPSSWQDPVDGPRVDESVVIADLDRVDSVIYWSEDQFYYTEDPLSIDFSGLNEVTEIVLLRTTLSQSEQDSLEASGPGAYQPDADTFAHYTFENNLDSDYSEQYTVVVDEVRNGVGILDADSWSLNGVDGYLEVPNSESWKFGPGSDFEITVRWRKRSQGGGPLVATTSVNNGNEGWYVSVDDDGDVRTKIDTGLGSEYLTVQNMNFREETGWGRWMTSTHWRDCAADEIGADVISLPSNATTLVNPLASSANLDQDKPLRIGRYSEGAGGDVLASMDIQYVAIFRRVLTDDERAVLGAWDGSIENEPVWLRPLSIYYINANDPHMKAAYNG